MQIGSWPISLSAASTIEAASLANQIGATPGTITLYGSSMAEATLNVGSAAGFGAAGTLYGWVNLSSDALIEFASGQITTIAAGGGLSLDGSQAFVADASDTSYNSALAGLSTVTGDLEINSGASVTTTGALSNSGYLALDGAPDDGGSSLTIGGTLTNDGTIQINFDNNTLSAASTLNAVSLANLVGSTPGTISLSGTSTAEATLDVGSAAGFGSAGVLSGNVDLRDNSLIEFASGQITTLFRSNLSLLGGARLADASDTSSNSALTGLAVIWGNASLNLYDGASVTASGSVNSDGAIQLDSATGFGGSSLTIGGELTNGGTIQIGPSDNTLSADPTIRAASLNTDVYQGGAIDLFGSSTAEATIDVDSPAGYGSFGNLDADVRSPATRCWNSRAASSPRSMKVL